MQPEKQNQNQCSNYKIKQIRCQSNITNDNDYIASCDCPENDYREFVNGIYISYVDQNDICMSPKQCRTNRQNKYQMKYCEYETSSQNKIRKCMCYDGYDAPNSKLLIQHDKSPTQGCLMESCNSDQNQKFMLLKNSQICIDKMSSQQVSKKLVSECDSEPINKILETIGKNAQTCVGNCPDRSIITSLNSPKQKCATCQEVYTNQENIYYDSIQQKCVTSCGFDNFQNIVYSQNNMGCYQEDKFNCTDLYASKTLTVNNKQLNFYYCNPSCDSGNARVMSDINGAPTQFCSQSECDLGSELASTYNNLLVIVCVQDICDFNCRLQSGECVQNCFNYTYNYTKQENNTQIKYCTNKCPNDYNSTFNGQCVKNCQDIDPFLVRSPVTHRCTVGVQASNLVNRSNLMKITIPFDVVACLGIFALIAIIIIFNNKGIQKTKGAAPKRKTLLQLQQEELILKMKQANLESQTQNTNTRLTDAEIIEIIRQQDEEQQAKSIVKRQTKKKKQEEVKESKNDNVQTVLIENKQDIQVQNIQAQAAIQENENQKQLQKQEKINKIKQFNDQFIKRKKQKHITQNDIQQTTQPDFNDILQKNEHLDQQQEQLVIKQIENQNLNQIFIQQQQKLFVNTQIQRHEQNIDLQQIFIQQKQKLLQKDYQQTTDNILLKNSFQNQVQKYKNSRFNEQ